MPSLATPELGPSTADGLDFHLTEFLAALAAAGYVTTTQRAKRRLLVPFLAWLRDARRTIVDLDEACIDEFLTRPSYRPARRGDPEGVAVRQFLEHLRKAGSAPPLRCPELSPTEVLVRRYIDHLREARGLCARSIEVYNPFVREFLAELGLPERLSALDAAGVRRYLLGRSRDRSISYLKLLVATLRSFLRFLFLDGATAGDLSAAVPPVRRWRFAALPPLLTSEQVEQVLATAERSTARGLRSFAILLLLARLGLRAGEIVAIELDDLHWSVGEIVVRGKGRRLDRLPLPQDVGEALALYLEARGSSTSRRVFLRGCAPHVGLSGPTAVCNVAREALQRAGLRPTGRVGAHIFRHSLATSMLRGGASLGEISQVLRHRSADTTQLYARVEFEALRGVARPWPTREESR